MTWPELQKKIEQKKAAEEARKAADRIEQLQQRLADKQAEIERYEKATRLIAEGVQGGTDLCIAISRTKWEEADQALKGK